MGRERKKKEKERGSSLGKASPIFNASASPKKRGGGGGRRAQNRHFVKGRNGDGRGGKGEKAGM